jgi:hypothetical protein
MTALLAFLAYYKGGLICLWLYKEKTSYGIKKMYLYIPPPNSRHTYDFVVVTSLTHPRKIIWLFYIGK